LHGNPTWTRDASQHDALFAASADYGCDAVAYDVRPALAADAGGAHPDLTRRDAIAVHGDSPNAAVVVHIVWYVYFVVDDGRYGLRLAACDAGEHDGQDA